MTPYYLDEQLFTWSRWRAGTPVDLGLIASESILISNRLILVDHTVGYCNGEGLVCRPKNEHKAVMFFKDGVHFWFHLTNKEFEAIYGQ